MRTLLLLALLMGCGTAWAEVSQADMTLAVLGEALHDQESMNYMAHAVVNRANRFGHLKGVYGLGVARTRSYPPQTLQRAKKAVSDGLATHDPTHGATHWLSDYDLAHCKPSRMAWRFKMVETAYQGQTHYYREAI